MISQQTIPSNFRLWLPIVATCSLLTIYSSMHRGIAPEIALSFRDKLDHFAVFALIATLILKALPRKLQGTQRWLIAFALTSAFGLCDEIVQHFNPSRTGDPLDWFADSLGALAAVVAYTAFKSYRRLADWALVRREA